MPSARHGPPCSWPTCCSSRATAEGKLASASLSELRTELVRLAGYRRLIHPDGPRRMDFSPILGRPSLIEDAMEAVGVDHMGTRNGDVLSWSWHAWIDEPAGVGVVRPEEDALGPLRDDLHHEVWAGMVGTGLKRIRRCQQCVELRIHSQPYVDIAVRLDLKAIHGAAHRHAAIDHAQPAG